MPPSRFPKGRGHGIELGWLRIVLHGTPKATHCAEFFSGPLLKQSDDFREHAVESKALPKQSVTEGTPCLTRSRRKRWECTYCVQRPRYPPMVEVSGPQACIDPRRRRGDARGIARSHVELR